MIIRNVLIVPGISTFVHYDMAAQRAGAVPDGFLYRGQPVTPGFTKIVQPAEILSVVLVLEDGSIAHGDCVDVTAGGFAGRDRVFLPREHLERVERELCPLLIGRSVAEFRSNLNILDGGSEGAPFHTAIRYGFSQALLHATSIAHREQLVETITREYELEGAELPAAIVPIKVTVPRENYDLHDRMILKKADLLPHAEFNDVDRHVGRDGSIFLNYVRRLSQRVQEIGAADYKPTFHFDVYGTFADAFDYRLDEIAAFLGKIEQVAAPYPVLIEAPIIARTQEEQIDLYAKLTGIQREMGIGVRIVVDDWCNTLDDIERFMSRGAGDIVQIKMPDLGGIENSIEAALYCRRNQFSCYLGGSNNETMHSARISAHIALACSPEFLSGRPGMGGDESLAFLGNEMRVAMAVVASSRKERKPAFSNDH
ncbi:methylaspartate ammonia-lyase [Rhizobium terrae]|uniref:methylaspartate ammonia-lyase n=1 Tax=Rhizobium terrae TaxID=2171756 RepID=UPI000E3DCD4F|nr:methylaspartate ammonia-lyase [Rhizobium terrae]